ncbi:MAG: hypothetical protein RR905_06315 [Aurantimicrobium sp.]
MTANKYTVVYVSDEGNGAPRLDAPARCYVTQIRASSIVAGNMPSSMGLAGIVWAVKHGTPAHEYLREHAAGRISSFSAFSAKEWLPKVVADPEFLSYPTEDVRPAVKATGLGSTDNGKKIDASVINGESITTHMIASSHVPLGKLATSEVVNEPARPHTTLITQVDVGDVSPVNDTLYNALEASKLEGMYGDQFPEDGNITIQWSKVHGRTNLRKFTITVDYKESN